VNAFAAPTPADCDRRFAECVQSSDLDGLVALYEPGACLVRQDGTIAIGHLEIRQALAALTSQPMTIEMHVVAAIETDDLAMLYNDWDIRLVGGDGMPTGRAGKAIEIVRRQPDGRWLFVIDDPFGRDRSRG